MHYFFRSLTRALPTAAALLFAGGLLFADRHAPDPTDAIRFVDLQTCFDSYAPVQKEMDRLREDLGRQLEDFKAREAVLREQQGEIGLLDPNSPEYAQQAFELESAGIKLDRDRKFVQSRLQSERLQLFVRAYGVVQKAAEELARREGYAAVMVVPPPVDNLPDDLQLRVERLQARSILWSHPDYDVTPALIAILNQES